MRDEPREERRDERRETRDERRDERRETRDERRETREERKEYYWRGCITCSIPQRIVCSPIRSDLTSLRSTAVPPPAFVSRGNAADGTERQAVPHSRDEGRVQHASTVAAGAGGVGLRQRQACRRTVLVDGRAVEHTREVDGQAAEHTREGSESS